MDSTTPPRSDPWRSGLVTRSAGAWPAQVDDWATGPGPAPPGAAVPDAAVRQRRTLLLFGGTAAAILIVGLVAMLVWMLGNGVDPRRGRHAPPVDARPPLARLCPPPTAPPATPAPPTSAPVPPPAGPRTVDREAGISYHQYGAPWLPWHDRWARGTLQVVYAVGQHFVTETYPGGTYHASILSGHVPAAVNDSLLIDLECTGRQLVADVRASYYPQPNRMEPIREERTVLGGLPAWVTIFRLHFSEPGLRATSELVGLAVLDVGRPDAAVLYVSIPDTHRHLDGVVDEVLASVRPV